MKSLKDYSLNIPEEDYHSLPAWSYSVIAKYAKDGFSAIATLHDRTAPTPSMEFGSLFDSIITRGRETLKYYVVDDTSCPPADKAVFDYLLSEGHTEPFNEIHSDVLLFAMDVCSYYQNYRPETRLSKIEKSSRYYDVRRTGKKLVSKQDWDDAFEMATIFRHDEYLKTIFGTRNTYDVEYLYQTQFQEEVLLDSGKTVDVKIMPDLLVVNHKDKTIQPVDLKTSSMPAYDFAENFIKYRYDIQATLYSDILSLVIGKDPVLYTYTILPYLFTDISRSDKVPVTYVYDQTSLSQSDGLSFTSNGKEYKYKHWMTLLDEILDYEEKNAKVPDYISTTGPNNLLDILSK